MNSIISSRQQWALDARSYRGLGRKRSGGRRQRRLNFDPLEERRLLATAPPVAEFPVRVSGGDPLGITEDPSGNVWVLLGSENIAEISNSGDVIAQYSIPTYSALQLTNFQTWLDDITYDAADKDIWFGEVLSEPTGETGQLASLDPTTGAITEYPVLQFPPEGIPPFGSIVAGPDGNIWFTEPYLNQIGMFDIKTHQVNQFNMPLADTQPQAMTVGPDGNFWFTEGGQNKIGSLNPYSHVINEYAFEPPGIANDQAEGIAPGPNDTVWFVTNQANEVDEFNIQTQQFFKQLPAAPPGNNNPPSAQLWSIAEGPDGNMYYVEPGLNGIGVSNASGAVGFITNVSPQPQPNFFYGVMANGVAGYPNVFATEPELGLMVYVNTTNYKLGLPLSGLPANTLADDSESVVNVDNELVFTDTEDGEIGVFDPYTQLDTMYPIPLIFANEKPTQILPNQETVDSNGNVWFTETGINAIGEFVPSTGAIFQTILTEYGSAPVGIAWDPIEKLFWLTEPSLSELVSYNPATSGSAVAPYDLPNVSQVLVDPTTGWLWLGLTNTGDTTAPGLFVEYQPVSEVILNVYSLNGNYSPVQMIWGPDGNIWFTETGLNTSNKPIGAIGVMDPATGLINDIVASAPTTSLAVGPSGTYGNTIWFTELGNATIGEVDVASQTIVNYVSSLYSDTNWIIAGPDGNEWYTSGPITLTDPTTWLGAVVLNQNDLPTKIAITTQPTSVQQTVFGGFVYGFGMVVSVENSQGQVDPFAQMGTIVIGLQNNPGLATLSGTLIEGTDDDVNVHIVDPGVAWFQGLTMNNVGVGYTIKAEYTDPAGNDFTAVSSPFYVSGAPDHLVVHLNLNAPIPPSTTPYVNAGQTFTATVTAEDSNGLVIPNFDDAILIAIDNNPPVNNNPPGLGVLNGTTPFGALYGTAAFNDLSIDQAGQGYTLQVSDITVGSNLPVTVTGAFNVVAGPAAQLVIPAIAGQPPFTLAAGSPFQLVAYAEDQYGNVAPTFNGSVEINLETGQTGTFNDESEKVDASSGVVTFSNLQIDTVGVYNLTVSDPNNVLTPATSGAITIIPAAPYQLVWAVQPPATVTEGIGFGATIDVEDQYGNLETGYSNNVSVALKSNPGSVTLGGTTSIAAVNGVAAFSGLTIGTIGNPYTLVATTNPTATTTLTSPASNGIDVVAPELVVTSQPSGSVVAGTGFTIVVTAETYLGTTDTAFNNQTVNLAINSGPANAPILGTVSATANNGVASFSGVVLDIAGAYILQATSGNLIPGDSKTITVVAGPAATLTITTEPPSTVQAGSGFGFVVAGEDQFGNVTNLTGSVMVQIENNPGGSTLGGTTTVPVAGGVATFSGLTLNKVAQGYTLEVTSGNLTPATTSAIAVTNAQASQLVIQPAGEPPNTVTAGHEFTFVVDAEDPFGNLALNYSGPVSVVLANNVSGTLTGTIPVNAVSGVATFSDLAIDTAGSFQLQASSGSLSPGTSTSIAVTPAAAAKLVWATEPPSTLVHDIPLTAAVDVEDQYGNLETGYAQNVTLALDVNPTSASLVGNTIVSAAGGVANFSGITISKVGTGYTLVATSGTLPASPQSTPIQVTPTPAVSLKFTLEPPSSVMVYQTFNVQVTALDQFGNPDPDFTGTSAVINIGLGGVSGAATLNGTLTATASDGVASFSGLYLTSVADGYTLVATSSGLTSGTSNSFDVTAAPPSQLVISTEPASSVKAGSPFGFVVSAEDPYGNLATSFNGTVTATLAAGPSGGALGGEVTATANDGVAVFSGLTVDQAGSGYKITASTSTNDVTSVTTSAFSVTPIAASQLVISAEPPTALNAGSTFGLTVTAEDPYGNVATSFNSPVILALAANPGTGTLGGDLDVTASQGQAVFSGLYLDTAGTGYAIQASSGNLAPVTTNAINVSPGAATTLVVAIPPPSTMNSGAPFGLAIWAEDSYGNLATSFNGTIDLALVNNPGNATLSGPLMATATGGVANFHAYITTDVAASGYTLQATSGSLMPATTGGITVVPSPATQLVVTMQPPSLLTPGATFGLVVAAEDQYGNVDPSFTGNVTVAVPSGSSSTLGGKTTVAVTDGLATFTGLTLTQSSTPVSLQVTSSPALASTTTSAISVTTPTQLAFSASSVSVNETTGTATVNVVRSGGYQGAVSINIATSNGTALAGKNYTSVSETLNFAAGQSSQTVAIPILNAGVLKSSLNFSVVLSSPGANATLGTPSTEMVTIQSSTPPPVPLVTLKSVQEESKNGKVTGLVLDFSGAVNATEAQAVTTYELVSANKSGAFTGKGVKTIKIKSAVYNAAADSVTLTTAAFGLKRPAELIVFGTGPHGLQDAEGRYIDGADNGVAGSNAVAIITKAGATVSAVPRGPMAVTPRGPRR